MPVSEPEYCKIIYLKTVATDGLIKDEGTHLRLSLDNGNTWSRIHKDLVQLTIPIEDRR